LLFTACLLLAGAAGLLLADSASAAEAPGTTPVPSAAARDHGPGSRGFSHQFQWQARDYPDGQVGLHFGLSQPLLLGGFNVATDVHLGRWVVEYSHGMKLDYNRVESSMLTASERAAHL